MSKSNKTIDYIELKLDENTSILIEPAKNDNCALNSTGSSSWDIGVSAKDTGRRVLEKTKDYFDETMKQVKSFSSGIIRQFSDMEQGPDEIEVEFSVSFGVDAGAVITSVNSESSLTFRLKWSR